MSGSVVSIEFSQYVIAASFLPPCLDPVFFAIFLTDFREVSMVVLNCLPGKLSRLFKGWYSHTRCRITVWMSEWRRAQPWVNCCDHRCLPTEGGITWDAKEWWKYPSLHHFTHECVLCFSIYLLISHVEWKITLSIPQLKWDNFYKNIKRPSSSGIRVVQWVEHPNSITESVVQGFSLSRFQGKWKGDTLGRR